MRPGCLRCLRCSAPALLISLVASEPSRQQTQRRACRCCGSRASDCAQPNLTSHIYRSETPFDFLKIDIQGAEKLALTGATETLKSVQVILAETSNVEYNKGAPSTVEMLSFFDSIGFQIFDIVR